MQAEFNTAFQRLFNLRR